MSARSSTFVVSCDGQADAYELMWRLARILVRAGAAERYGMQVRRIPGGRRAEPAWGVYLVDRKADQAAPTVTAQPARTLAAALAAAAA
ncbi:hypothetical protein [Kitasatospora sp. NPDC001527]|uniref:hypothetical protein n=1 Tax=Kitasatospora sp. NPDC001527 TaxID=3154519 RepID=UPI00332D5E9A